MIVLDFETALIARGLLAPPATCAAILCQGIASYKDEATLHHVSEGSDPISWAFEEGDPIVGHNFAFDVAVAMAEWPELVPVIFKALAGGRVGCTMIREKMIATAAGNRWVGEDGRKKSYSLEASCVRRDLGEPWKSQWRLRYSELRDVPLSEWPEEAVRYPIEDVLRTGRLWRAQEEDRAEGLEVFGVDPLEDEPRQVRAAVALHLSSCWGFYVDPDRLERLTSETQARVEELRPKLTAAGLIKADGKRSVKAARELALAEAGDEVVYAPKGNVSVSKEAIARYGVDVLDDYAELATLRSVLDKDVPMFSHGIVQTRYDLADTGRTTSSAPNLQNLRRAAGVRECLAARPGRVLLVADLSIGELRTWAQCCLWLLGESVLAETILAGRDPHTALGADLAGWTYESMVERLAAGDADAKRYRQLGKHTNFGLPGGMGAASFVQLCWQFGVVISHEEAVGMKAAWSARWPESQRYFRLVSDQGDDATQVQLVSNRVRSGTRYTQRCNGYFQGLLADLAKDVCWRLTEAAWVGSGPLNRGRARLVAFNHDEWVVEIDAAHGHDAAAELEAIVAEAGRTWTPDVPPVVEPLLATRWSKRAEVVRDEEGRLTPWEETQT
jgi:hypothetical protein